MKYMSLYLSRILGNKVYSKDGNFLGRLKDIGVATEFKNPKVIVAKIKTSSGLKFYSWSGFEIVKKQGQYVISCSETIDVSPDNTTMLVKHILDKQIIDIDGRKVVRVNDIRLFMLQSGTFAAAVDIGAEGLLRRLGFAKPLKRLGLKLNSKLMLWDEVAAVIPSNENIQLSKSYDRLSTLHPSDLADIIEDFDTKTGAIIFSRLDNATAADVLEEMEEDSQLNLLKRLSADKAADILEEMPADEAADVLDGMNEKEAEVFLSNMEKEAQEEVRGLLEYDEDAVGSLMNKDIIFLKDKLTLDRAIAFLRESKPEEEQIYYLYVVDSKGRLEGTVSLRDLVISEPNLMVSDIMNTDFKFMYDTDNIDDLIKNVSKYNLSAIPVVDSEKVLVGNVIINDIIYELLKNKRRTA